MPRKLRFLALPLLLLVAGAIGMSQTPAKNQAAPPGPRPQSTQEAQALQSLNSLVHSPTAQDAQIDQGIQNFITKFPQSEFKEAVYTWGMMYYQSKNEYPQMLQYGENALQANPNSLLALISLGRAIPMEVHDTDLDRDQRLSQAEQYDQKLLDLAGRLPPVINGHQLTPEQLQGLQGEIRSTAHDSLGLIAFDRKQFPQSIAEFQQSIPLDNPSNQAVDYYRLAQSQEGAKDYKGALDSLDKALQLGSGDATLQTLASSEKAKVNRLLAASTPQPK